jgi:hypothetical protein
LQSELGVLGQGADLEERLVNQQVCGRTYLYPPLRM